MGYAILAIASPAEGIGTVRRICAALPQHLPLPVACLQQFAPGVGVQDIIPRASRLCARYAVEGESIEAGCVLFSPPGHGLIVAPGERVLVPRFAAVHQGPGPADMFLRSIAAAYGAEALVLVVAGWGADAFEGAHAVKDAGGTLLVQKRDGMAFRDATQALTRTRLADETLDAEHLAVALTRRMFGTPPASRGPAALAPL